MFIDSVGLWIRQSRDWYESICEEIGESKARQQLSLVKAEKSLRRYNNKERVLPGTIFRHERKQYVLTGNLTNGQYFRAYRQGIKNFPAKQCIVVARKSLVYVA